MCGCNISLSKRKEGAVDLSFQNLIDKNFPTILVWAWCINKDKVIAEFKKNGLDISEEDFDNIIKVHDSGDDKKKFKIDFKDMLTKEGLFTVAEINNSQCNYNLNTVS